MANVVVSGAGSSEVNGTYEPGGFINDRPIYGFGVFTIWWEGGAWIIFEGEAGSFGLTYYYSADDVAEPWLATTWGADSGFDPPPTVSQETSGPAGVKTLNGVSKSLVKTVDGVTFGNIKTIQGVS